MAMTNRANIKRDGLIMSTLDDLVPQDHLVRTLEATIDWKFIYPLVKSLYSNFGRRSIDPVVLFKMIFINYTFGINVSAKLYSVPKKDDQIIFDLIVLYSKLFFYLFTPWHEPVNLFWMLNDINLRHYLQYVFYVIKRTKSISFSCLNQAEY